MVKTSPILKKYAFTMIELIFAIVIIAISVISLPMMIQTSGDSIEKNILQEAIFAAESILNESTTYYWDKNSQNDANLSDGYSRVINTGDCIGAGVPYRRVGHINRQCLDDNTTGVDTVGDNSSVEWAANIYSGTIILEGNSVNGASATYKRNYNATVLVNSCATGACLQFGLETNNANLKELVIKITDPDTNNPLVLLRAYTANIGAVQPESRVF
ncbi:MAG: prepilin-type N-terminal cleavage/methylation domain-containing protein [Sulfurimonas sp.]|nr:prepilin-type N-terminal cleavage/methylation domain-containing protein [Sulfurimonas sp.]